MILFNVTFKARGIIKLYEENYLILFICISVLFISWKRNQKKEIPPGTIRISQNFFVDQTEIRNLDWKEFEYWIHMVHGLDSASKILPDTLVWRNKGRNYVRYAEYYLRHPNYNEHPVVGISYNKANQYCRWRTHRVLEWILITSKKGFFKKAKGIKIEFTPEKYFNGNFLDMVPDTSIKFPVFRLPTKKEWVGFSEAKEYREFPFGFDTSNTAKKKYQYDTTYFLGNHKYKSIPDKESWDRIHPSYKNIPSDSNNYNTPIYCKAGYQNSFGLLGIYGNISEMTNKKGIALGGNFETYITKTNINDTVQYHKPEHWLGFRCVAEYMNWNEYQEYLKTQN